MGAVTTGADVGDSARLRAAQVLNAVRQHRGVSEKWLADQLGIAQPTVNNYTSGRSPLTIVWMARFAETLGVDPVVFHMTPNEAIRWIIDNRPNLDQVDRPKSPRGDPSSTKW